MQRINYNGLIIHVHPDILFGSSYDDETYNHWTKGVDKISQQNLDKPLIVRDSNTKLITVNFDPEVSVFAIHAYIYILYI